MKTPAKKKKPNMARTVSVNKSIVKLCEILGQVVKKHKPGPRLERKLLTQLSRLLVEVRAHGGKTPPLICCGFNGYCENMTPTDCRNCWGHMLGLPC
jgi:hypothetical protein